MCSLLCKVPGEVLHEKWRPDFAEGNLGLSASTADKDDTGPQLVLEIALARMVLMPSAVADVHSQQCPWPWRDKAVLREARLQKRGPEWEGGRPPEQCSPAGPRMPCAWSLGTGPVTSM